jgi:hypothetical protein
MKVFISWSGQRSHAAAELLSVWIKCVLQATRPWISSRDIDRGALWFSEIGDQLKDTSVGIICLTAENKEKPWILFEAGALAKGLTSSRVCTFLIDLKPTDVRDPLAQFNHTMPEKESFRSLVRTLNSALGENGLDERVLVEVFETYWPQFDEKFAALLEANKSTETVKKRSEANLLEEVLETTRGLSSRLSRLELGLSERASEAVIKPGPTFAAVRASVKAMVDAGMPTAEILSAMRAQHRVPTSAILRAIARAKSDVDEIPSTGT